MAVSAGDTGPTPRDLALQSAPTTGWARGTASTQGAPGGDWQARTEEAGQWRWPGFRGRGEAVGAKPREESTRPAGDQDPPGRQASPAPRCLIESPEHPRHCPQRSCHRGGPQSPMSLHPGGAGRPPPEEPPESEWARVAGRRRQKLRARVRLGVPGVWQVLLGAWAGGLF